MTVDPRDPSYQLRTLTEADIASIRDVLANSQVCSRFTDEEVVTVKSVVALFTPENVQAANELLSGFRDTKKSLWIGAKRLIALLLLFLLWLSWRHGFLIDKIK